MPSLATNLSSTTTSVKLGGRKPVLQQLAQETNNTVHNLILEAIDNHTEQLHAKLAYDKRALASYADYQETGLHITLNEFRDWVNSLETDTPQEKPVCHN